MVPMQAGQQDGRRLGRSSMRDQQQDVRSSADSRQSNASLRRGSEQDPFTDRSRQQRCSLATFCAHQSTLCKRCKQQPCDKLCHRKVVTMKHSTFWIQGLAPLSTFKQLEGQTDHCAGKM